MAIGEAREVLEHERLDRSTALELRVERAQVLEVLQGLDLEPAQHLELGGVGHEALLGGTVLALLLLLQQVDDALRLVEGECREVDPAAAVAFDQRERPRFGASCLHLLALGVGAQLHPAMLLLIVASLLLWRRGVVQVHWGGVAAGIALTAVLLVPWWQAAAAEPAIVAAREGFPFRGLIWFQPWIKGLSYWLRYPSLLINKQSAIFDFSALVGAGADRLLAPLAKGLVGIAGAATIVAVLLANIDFFRRRFAAGLRAAFARSTGVEPRRFVEDYAFWCFVAAAVVFAAAPTTPQSWQAVPLFQAAVLPVVFWLGRQLDGPAQARVARLTLAAATAASVAVVLALAAGGPNFRCGGRHGVVIPLRAASPMFEDLGLQRTCRWPLNVPNEWWPDVLPAE